MTKPLLNIIGMKESNIKLMVYEMVNNISLLEILVYIFFI